MTMGEPSPAAFFFRFVTMHNPNLFGSILDVGCKFQFLTNQNFIGSDLFVCVLWIKQNKSIFKSESKLIRVKFVRLLLLLRFLHGREILGNTRFNMAVKIEINYIVLFLFSLEKCHENLFNEVNACNLCFGVLLHYQTFAQPYFCVVIISVDYF